MPKFTAKFQPSKDAPEQVIDFDIRLTVGSLTKIKRDFGFDLANALVEAEKFVEFISTEPEKLVGMFYTICERQAEANGIAPEQFGELFDGDTLDAACKALLEGAIDFFPKARGRDAIRRGMPKAWAKIEQEVNNQVDKKLDSMFSTTVGSLLESSGSTPPG